MVDPTAQPDPSIQQHASGGAQAADAGYAAPPVDALVSSMANLIFVTTGESACAVLGEEPNQISLTPSVAHRIAQVLGCILSYPDLESRHAILAQWSADEAPRFPHGCVAIDARAAWIGIEPLGAGVRVAVEWAFVPALVWQLEMVARSLMGPT